MSIISVKSAMTEIMLSVPFLLVLATVFVIDNSLARGVVSGKYFWFYGAMGLVSMATAVSCMVYRKPVRFSIFDALIAVFCLSGLGVTCYHTGGITTKFILLLLLLILYFYFRIFLSQNKRNLPGLLLFFVLTGLVEAVWGLNQLYGFSFSQHHLFKTTGSFFNPGPYAGYLAVVFPMALYYFLTIKSSKGDLVDALNKNYAHGKVPFRGFRGYLGAITCIAIALILPATMSRASWLATIAGSGVVLYARYVDRLKKQCQRYKKQAIMIGSALALFSVLALAGVYYLKKDSADGRALMWKVALKTIPKHPLGVGLGQFPGTYATEQALYFASGEASEQEELVAGSPEYAFNEYLQMAVEWGIVPFLLFGIIIAGALYRGYKRKQTAATASLVSLLVFAGMSYPFSVLPFLIIFVFLLSTIENNSVIAGQARNDRKWMTSVVMILAGFLLTGLCLYNRYPTYNAYKKWNLAQVLYQTKSYEPAKKEYAALYPYLNDQINFMFEYGHLLSNSKEYEAGNEILQQTVQICGDPMLYNVMGKNCQAMQKYEQAEACFIRATQIIPNRLYPWYLLCKLYAEMELPEKVQETAAIVLTKEPKVQSPAVREMREEVITLCHPVLDTGSPEHR
ncbi:membrane protein [Bacteroidia bacterium]|nr:membrane protein [Bacteroidia bacterium]